ncbi:hypothetical protein PFISCL1PPCAC_14544, partial [Pristionchus fissidentatus]
NNKGYSNLSCATFFGAFDFIPFGTNVPSFNWEGGDFPSGISCVQEADEEECMKRKVCGIVPTQKNFTSLAQFPISSAFLNTLTSSMDLCQMAKAALLAADAHYSASAGRKKRGAGTSPTSTSVRPTTPTIDIPGYGSCEYANTNFKSAADCIEWYQRNGLMIHVYFETLEAKKYTQGATYSV